jgi:hypothetical protein
VTPSCLQRLRDAPVAHALVHPIEDLADRHGSVLAYNVVDEVAEKLDVSSRPARASHVYRASSRERASSRSDQVS